MSNHELITIPEFLKVEIGSPTLGEMLDQIRETVEAETGVPMAWRTMVNRDAIELVPVDPAHSEETSDGEPD